MEEVVVDMSPDAGVGAAGERRRGAMMKVKDVIRLLEREGWFLVVRAAVTGNTNTRFGRDA